MLIVVTGVRLLLFLCVYYKYALNHVYIVSVRLRVCTAHVCTPMFDIFFPPPKKDGGLCASWRKEPISLEHASWVPSTSDQYFVSFQPIWCHPHTPIRIILFSRCTNKHWLTDMKWRSRNTVWLQVQKWTTKSRRKRNLFLVSRLRGVTEHDTPMTTWPPRRRTPPTQRTWTLTRECAVLLFVSQVRVVMIHSHCTAWLNGVAHVISSMHEVCGSPSTLISILF